MKVVCMCALYCISLVYTFSFCTHTNHNESSSIHPTFDFCIIFHIHILFVSFLLELYKLFPIVYEKWSISNVFSCIYHTKMTLFYPRSWLCVDLWKHFVPFLVSLLNVGKDIWGHRASQTNDRNVLHKFKFCFLFWVEEV